MPAFAVRVRGARRPPVKMHVTDRGGASLRRLAQAGGTRARSIYTCNPSFTVRTKDLGPMPHSIICRTHSGGLGPQPLGTRVRFLSTERASRGIFDYMKESHPCPRCGVATSNRIYCSNRCSSSRPHPGLRKQIIYHKCGHCGVNTSNDKYCSRSCAASVNNTIVPKRGRQIRPSVDIRCKMCGATFTIRGDRIRHYCSIVCQRKFECPWTPETLFIRDPQISRGLVKKLLLRWNIMRLQCSRCGITEWQGEPAPIDLDHINGDKHDHSLANLRMLCANCHRLTPTHGWKNASLRKKQSQMGAGIPT